MDHGESRYRHFRRGRLPTRLIARRASCVASRSVLRLRRATRDIVVEGSSDPRGGPLVCHTDICPGMSSSGRAAGDRDLDFEFATPGRRVWDLAMAGAFGSRCACALMTILRDATGRGRLGVIAGHGLSSGGITRSWSTRWLSSAGPETPSSAVVSNPAEHWEGPADWDAARRAPDLVDWVYPSYNQRARRPLLPVACGHRSLGSRRDRSSPRRRSRRPSCPGELHRDDRLRGRRRHATASKKPMATSSTCG